MNRVPLALSVRLLFGGRATRMGFTWVAIIAGFIVLASTIELEPTTFRRQGTAEITKVEERTYEGKTRYIAHYEYKSADGASHWGRSMSDERPALGPHPYGYNDDDGGTELVGMKPAPDDSGLGILLFTALGFVLLVFEVPAAIRRIRQLRRSYAVHARVTSATVIDTDIKRGRFTTRLQLAYEDAQGVTHETAIERQNTRGLDELKSLPLLVDSRDPKVYLTRFDLPAGTLSYDGELVGPWTGWFHAIIPLAALVAFPAAVLLVLIS